MKTLALVLAIASGGANGWGGYAVECVEPGCHVHYSYFGVGRLWACWHTIRSAFDSWHIEPQFEGTCNDLWYVSPPAHHGYYYFSPYNYRHVTAYSRDASMMGMDPYMPFSNELFRRRYKRQPEAMPHSDISPHAYPQHSAPLWQRGR